MLIIYTKYIFDHFCFYLLCVYKCVYSNTVWSISLLVQPQTNKSSIIILKLKPPPKLSFTVTVANDLLLPSVYIYTGEENEGPATRLHSSFIPPPHPHTIPPPHPHTVPPPPPSHCPPPPPPTYLDELCQCSTETADDSGEGLITESHCAVRGLLEQLVTHWSPQHVLGTVGELGSGEA